MEFTRRQFLEASGVIAAGSFVAVSSEAQLGPSAQKKRLRKMFRLAAGGRRISNAAKKHNANMRFATWDAANTHRAHKGDNSKIVELTVTVDEYERLFQGRATVADLRKARKKR